MCEGIAGLNFKDDSNTNINSNQDCDKFYDGSLYSFAGDKKLMEIFLANFVHEQPHSDMEMETIARTSKVITCDHTFKVSKYICATRGNDSKCMKQFENLFIALNEDHKVVRGWRLTKSTSFEEIRHFLQSLNDCLDNPLSTVIVDDCCKVRNQYQSLVNSQLRLLHF